MGKNENTDGLKVRKLYTAKGGYKFYYENGKSVFIHVEVMEKHLGRKLVKGEKVHHKDQNPQNNDIDNPQLCASESEHQLIHAKIRGAIAEANPPKEKVCTRCGILKQVFNPDGTTNFYKRGYTYAAECKRCNFKRRNDYEKKLRAIINAKKKKKAMRALRAKK